MTDSIVYKTDTAQFKASGSGMEIPGLCPAAILPSPSQNSRFQVMLMLEGIRGYHSADSPYRQGDLRVSAVVCQGDTTS